tara:strand:+ start:174260 stop:175048 length:789 start_codon:yes stop_codon:yes gene_type:complete
MIQLNDVSVRYGDIYALRPTSLKFHKGQFTVLLGASGAGKSTLLRCINMMCQPSAGTIDVAGLGLLKNRRALQEHRRQTGMVFQQHQLIARRTALQNVLMGRLAYHSTLRSLFPLSQDEQRIGLRALDRVGLLDKALARVDQLSGGQQQRVGIARALTQRPKLILADEPVASLDPSTSEKVLEILRQICKEDGISAVVSLHQVDLALKYADRVVGLAHGKVIFDAVPADLNENVLAALYEVKQSNVSEESTLPFAPILSFSM